MFAVSVIEASSVIFGKINYYYYYYKLNQMLHNDISHMAVIIKNIRFP